MPTSGPVVVRHPTSRMTNRFGHRRSAQSTAESLVHHQSAPRRLRRGSLRDDVDRRRAAGLVEAQLDPVIGRRHLLDGRHLGTARLGQPPRHREGQTAIGWAPESDELGMRGSRQTAGEPAVRGHRVPTRLPTGTEPRIDSG